MANTYQQMAAQGVAGQPEQPKYLHAILQRLRELEKQAHEYVARTTRIANVVIGEEPPQIGKADGSPKSPVEPPMLRQVDDVIDELARLADALSYQIGRLERL